MKYLIDTHTLLWGNNGRNGIAKIKLDATDALFYAKIPLREKHKDPFDRMLVATAINNEYTLVSKDHNMPQYHEDGLSVFW